MTSASIIFRPFWEQNGTYVRPSQRFAFARRNRIDYLRSTGIAKLVALADRLDDEWRSESR